MKIPQRHVHFLMPWWNGKRKWMQAQRLTEAFQVRDAKYTLCLIMHQSWHHLYTVYALTLPMAGDWLKYYGLPVASAASCLNLLHDVWGLSWTPTISNSFLWPSGSHHNFSEQHPNFDAFRASTHFLLLYGSDDFASCVPEYSCRHCFQTILSMLKLVFKHFFWNHFPIYLHSFLNCFSNCFF